MTQMPNEEQRGGDRPDWEKVVAGEPLPEQPAVMAPAEQDSAWLERAAEIIKDGGP